MTTVVPVALTAAHGPWGYGHGWFPFFPFVGFLFLILILLLVFGVFGRRRMWHGGPYAQGPWAGPPVGGQPGASPESARLAAEADLARRFAAGEIDDEEYERRVATLRRLGAG